MTQFDAILYREQRPGRGALPWLDSTVVFHHRQSGIDGIEVADTYREGQPRRVRVGDLPSGLRDALLLMRAGAQWRVIAPDPPSVGVESAASMSVHVIELLEVDSLPQSRSDEGMSRGNGRGG
jgi:FKBP-type peptidyl-prolyl cis-trans isomerase